MGEEQRPPASRSEAVGLELVGRASSTPRYAGVTSRPFLWHPIAVGLLHEGINTLSTPSTTLQVRSHVFIIYIYVSNLFEG